MCLLQGVSPHVAGPQASGLHGWRVMAERGLAFSVPVPSVSRSHTVGNIPAMGLYTHVFAAGAQEAWCAGTGEDDGPGHRGLPSCRVVAEKISVAGTASNSSLSFFAYLRMLVVFLHSLEGISES